MSYTALYRKFRPNTFEEIVGQEHITKTLKNQVIAQRIGHAYLFSGSRGTGKTSAAKVLARAINCLNPKDGEPCNECEICKSILNGSLTDVVEMDAASNNSVEDIRAIREEVNFLPTKAKYRIYIIDEVHMLSIGAFNALLKTLEEPPKHVKFILATTEPQKLPMTILSRCQRFDFKKIPDKDIIKRLDVIEKESNLEISQRAKQIIASLSEGAMRDALSILERCIQDGNTKISDEEIRQLVGIPEIKYIYDLVKSIFEKDVASSLKTIEEVLSNGKDIEYFTYEIIKYIKDILIYKTTKKNGMYSEDEIKQIEELSKKVSTQSLLEYIYKLSELSKILKTSMQKSILFQAEIIKMCNKIPESDLLARIERIERLIDGNDLSQKLTASKKDEVEKIEIDAVPTQNSNSIQKNKEEKVKTTNIPKQDINTTRNNDFWKETIEKMKQKKKMLIYSNLVNTSASIVNDSTIQIELTSSVGKEILEKTENKEELQKELSKSFGKEMKVKYLMKDSKKETKNELEKIAEELDIPLIIED